MHPIKDLVKEHALVKLALRVLEKACDQIEAGKDMNQEDMRNVVLFIREFADKCHHGKEEALLFPAIKENNIPEEVALVDIFIEEHKISRGFVKNMADAIEASLSPIFIENARKYIQLLDQHIDRENQFLFPMAEKSLSEDKLKELEVGFENVEKNIIGEKRHQELFGLIQNLKEIYL